MDTSRRQGWVGPALLLGVVYSLIGIVFALPTEHVLVWRLAAWMVSGGAYVAHIAYEHLRLRNSPRLTALHVAVAVAIGALGLAVAATVHELLTASHYRLSLLLAFLAWPIITALPAFLVALAAGTVLTRFSRSA